MDVRAHIQAHRDEFVATLSQWLAIPSISADPAHHDDVRRSAQWLADHFTQTGFPTVEIWETPGMPAVFAEWPAADPEAPTVLVYGHHDVQPVDPVDAWHTDPFTPTVRGDQLVGRGASDDKGQILFHTLGLRANLAVSGADAPPVTLKFLIEGEEESGSPHFADLLTRHRARLACDVIVISDTTMWSADTPSMCMGMRGLTDCQIDVYGPRTDLHSGSFGGAVPNPARALAALLAGLPRRPRPSRHPRLLRRRRRSVPSRTRHHRRNCPSTKQPGSPTPAATPRSAKPGTASSNGSGCGPPPKSTACGADTPGKAARRSCRGLPTPNSASASSPTRNRRASRNSSAATSTTTFPPECARTSASAVPECGPAPPTWTRWRCAPPATRWPRRSETKVYSTREGGSGPEADLADILGAPLVFVAVGLNSDRIHAPNEKVEIPLLLKGAETVAYLWDSYATVLRSGDRA